MYILHLALIKRVNVYDIDRQLSASVRAQTTTERRPMTAKPGDDLLPGEAAEGSQ